MRLARRLYSILSWSVVALGAVHMLTTFALRGGTTAGRVWFFGAGIATALCGALNLLNRAYGAGARGVRWVCLGNNVLMTVFAAIAGVLTNAGPGELVAVLGLVGGATVLSFVTAPLHPRPGHTTAASGS